ncbi:MAG: hypothetical protein V4754_12350 [Pseudomonadota bacterium]
MSRITVAQKRFSELQADATNGPDDDADFSRLAAASQNLLDAVNGLQSLDVANAQVRLDPDQARSLSERFAQLFGQPSGQLTGDASSSAEQGELGRVGFNFLASPLAGNVGDVQIDQPALRAAFQTDRAGTLSALENGATQLGQIGTDFAPDASRTALSAEQDVVIGENALSDAQDASAVAGNPAQAARAANGQAASDQLATEQAASDTAANASAAAQATVADIALQELLAENATAAARDSTEQAQAARIRDAAVAAESQDRLQQDAILAQNSAAAAALDDQAALAEQNRVAELTAQSTRDRQADAAAQAARSNADQTALNADASQRQRDAVDAAVAQQQAALRSATNTDQQTRLADDDRSDRQTAEARASEAVRGQARAAAAVLARDQAAGLAERARDAAGAAQVLEARRLQTEQETDADAARRSVGERYEAVQLAERQANLAATTINPDARLIGEQTTARGNSPVVNQLAAAGTVPGTTLEQNAVTLSAGVNPVNSAAQRLARAGVEAASVNATQPGGANAAVNPVAQTVPQTAAALNVEQGRQLARDPATAAAIAAYHLNESQFKTGDSERQAGAPSIKTVPIAPVAAVTRVTAVDPVDGSRARP